MGNLREHLQSRKTLGDYIASLSELNNAVVKYKNQMKEYR